MCHNSTGQILQHAQARQQAVTWLQLIYPVHHPPANATGCFEHVLPGELCCALSYTTTSNCAQRWTAPGLLMSAHLLRV